jgi:hypothetical protein
MVSPSRGNHLCNGGQRLPQRAKRSLLPSSLRSEDIQERSSHPRDVRHHVQTPSAADNTGEAVGVANLCTARPSPVQ